MFGLGFGEILLILALALIFVGPQKLPTIAKALGKGYGEFRRYMSELQDAVNVSIQDDEPAKPRKTPASKAYEENFDISDDEPEKADVKPPRHDDKPAAEVKEEKKQDA